jgi:hypothetical protein
LLWRHTQTLAYGIRVEIKDPTNAFEGVRPFGLVGEEPLLRVVEEPAAGPAGSEAILLKAIERVMKDGNHEPLLGCLLAPRSEVLRRQDDVELRHTNEYSSQMKIRFHRHTCLYNRHDNAISSEFYARGSTCAVLQPHAAGEPPACSNQLAVRARPRSIQFLDKPPPAL